MIALDASALLAFLFGERGADQVAPHVADSCLSAVNLAEVLSRFARDGHDPRAVARRIAATAIEIVPFTPAQAVIAASLVPRTRQAGLALGDRACLALAISRSIPALTADRGWSALRLDIPVHVLR